MKVNRAYGIYEMERTKSVQDPWTAHAVKKQKFVSE